MRRETLALRAGFDCDTIRLSIGIEHINDIIVDLDQAPAAVHPVPASRAMG